MAELVLVAGTARSGKSLLCSLFDGHPMVQVWPLEVGLSKHFGVLFDGAAARTPAGRQPARPADALISDVSDRMSSFYEDFDLTDLDLPRLRDVFRRKVAMSDFGDFASVLRCLGESAAEVLGSSPRVLMFDVKTKRAHLHVLLDSGAPVRVLLMTRDPRHVYLALRAKHFMNYGAGNWLDGNGQPLLRALVDHIVQYGGGPHVSALATHPRVYVLRYEELVREPEKVLSRVVAWLGIETRWELMTVPTRFGRPATLDRHAKVDWRVQDPGMSATGGRLSMIEEAVLRCCFTADPVMSGVTPAVGRLQRVLLVLACLVPLAGELMRFVRGHWVGVVRAGVLNRAYALRVLLSERVV